MVIRVGSSPILHTTPSEKRAKIARFSSFLTVFRVPKTVFFQFLGSNLCYVAGFIISFYN